MESEAILPVIVMTIIVAAITGVALARQTQIRETKRMSVILDELLVVLSHQSDDKLNLDPVIDGLIETLSSPLPMQRICEKQYIDFYNELTHCETTLLFLDSSKYRDLVTTINLQRGLIQKRYDIDGIVNQI